VSTRTPATPTLAALRRTRARQQATLRRIRPLGLIVLALALAKGARAQPGPGLHGVPLAISAALAGLTVSSLGVLIPQLASRPVPSRVRAACVALLFLSSASLAWLQPTGPGVVGVLVVVAAAGRWMPVGWAASLAGLALAVLTAAEAASMHRHRSVSSLVFGALTVVAIFSLALFTRRMREGTEQVERLLIELEQTRGAELRAAALAERQRLAREMHDLLAHSLSGLLLQLEGARLLAVNMPNDPRLAVTVERAHRLAKSGLEEARRAISMLREDEPPGPDRLTALVTEFEHDSGISCRFVVSGNEHDLEPGVRLAIYRVAQEALTNVRKHAHPERVEVHLSYEPHGTRLTVEDFGAAIESPLPVNGGGYGLTGMRERAELLGGTLTAVATDTGFRVVVEVPA
jgi:signal transduction histidine kinase